MDKEGSFNFRLYSHTPWGIHKPLLLEEQDGENGLVPQESIPVKAQTLLANVASVAPTLLTTKLEKEKASQYTIPKGAKVAKLQPEHSHDLRRVSNLECLVVEAKFIGDGHHQILACVETLFCSGWSALEPDHLDFSSSGRSA